MVFEVNYSDGTLKRFEPVVDPDNELRYKIKREIGVLELQEITNEDPDEPLTGVKYKKVKSFNLDHVREYGFVDGEE